MIACLIRSWCFQVRLFHSVIFLFPLVFISSPYKYNSWFLSKKEKGLAENAFHISRSVVVLCENIVNIKTAYNFDLPEVLMGILLLWYRKEKYGYMNCSHDVLIIYELYKKYGFE